MRLAALLLLAVLTGCAPARVAAPDVRVIDSACAWVRLITLSPQDTAETKRQVLAHDRAVLINCSGNTMP